MVRANGPEPDFFYSYGDWDTNMVVDGIAVPINHHGRLVGSLLAATCPMRQPK